MLDATRPDQPRQGLLPFPVPREIEIVPTLTDDERAKAQIALARLLLQVVVGPEQKEAGHDAPR